MTDHHVASPNTPNEIEASEVVEKANWPLSYRLQPPTSKQSSLQRYGFGTGNAPQTWWSHTLYRGPEDKEVEILYSRDKAQSELVAQQFINEPIVGFDMEWPWNDSKKQNLQSKVGLIQIASESKIGLFHIGLHVGRTTEDIVAPTLRRIIESPKIGKVGVHILQADFGRLKRFFGLKPQGAVEISHLYRLVKFGSHKPGLVSVKLVSLAQQVQDQLGLPLYKGDVRTSNWSKPLSQEQIKYAAGDAYAGFMLYHCLDAQRLAMKPTPPLPIHAERYPQGPSSRDDSILLDTEDGTTVTSEAFFGVKPVRSGTAEAKGLRQNRAPVAKATASNGLLDPLTQALYSELATRRAALAESSKIPVHRIMSDRLLELLAHERPSNTTTLLSVKGFGKQQEQKYGDQWIQIITQFLVKNGLEPSPRGSITVSPIAGREKEGCTVAALPPPLTPRTTRKRVKVSSDSSPAFDTPPPRTPQLHTGLSFTMAATDLATADDISLLSSDESLISLDLGSPSRQANSQLKRKRVGSPMRNPRQQQVTTLLHEPRSSVTEKLCLTQQKGVAQPAAQQLAPAAIENEQLATDIRIARNKLMAFSKLVTRKLPPRPTNAPPVVTELILDLIVRRRPQTQDDLERIPGINGFLLACEKSGTSLLRNVLKFTTPPQR